MSVANKPTASTPEIYPNALNYTPVGKVVIGWREKVDLPEWGVKGILAKIDTGARTSAIHVENVRHTDGGKVAFDVVLSRNHPDRVTTIETDIIRETHVRTSTGHGHDRIVVGTVMRIGGVQKRIELTLVSRRHMLCRMLVGRTALEEDFLVDVSLKHTAAKP
jgi:hypothetical protein